MKSRTLGLVFAALAAGLAAAACSVQFVSPYNAELASSLTKLHEDVLKTAADIARNAASPATKAKARVEEYAKTYDDWRARADTMRVLAEAANPGAIGCADLMKRLQPAAQADVTASQAASSETTQVDCQTFLILRLRTRIDQTQRLHAAACAPDNPNFHNDCAGGFGTPPGPVPVGKETDALLVQPLLRTIRALIWVQEAKKPKTT